MLTWHHFLSNNKTFCFESFSYLVYEDICKGFCLTKLMFVFQSYLSLSSGNDHVLIFEY